MIGPKEKRERSVGERLHLKGERCSSHKCAMVRRPYRPGVHGPKEKRRRLSDFGKQLVEKQKFKLSYGIDERGLRNLFKKVQKKSTGDVAEKLLMLLERRLDNVVFSLGFAKSRLSSRQLISHGHILVNKKRVKSPGYTVQKGDLISIRQESRGKAPFSNLKETLKNREVPNWLELDKENLEGKVLSLPSVETPFDVSLLVESFSR